MLYFDTSAILPYYRRETASDAVQGLLLRQTESVIISYLTKVEFASALARWVRMEELSEPQANQIEAAFLEDIEENRFVIKPVTRQHFERANHWLFSRKTNLRTLDALHLACAAMNEAHLVTLDAALRQAAEFFGLRVHAL